MRKINEIIVHCTATFSDQKVTIDILRKWHKQRGFKDVGYHYLIDLDGNILTGRPVEQVGAHCKDHNAHSIGVAYAGGLGADARPADTLNEKQRASLIQLLSELREQYPDATIHGHNEFANKACPCFDVQQFVKEVGL